MLNKLIEAKRDINLKKKEVDGLYTTIRLVNMALEFDKKFPQVPEDKNSQTNELKKDYPTFFDEESGNTSSKESLEQLKEYLVEEIKSNIIQYDKSKLVFTTHHNEYKSFITQSKKNTTGESSGSSDAKASGSSTTETGGSSTTETKKSSLENSEDFTREHSEGFSNEEVVAPLCNYSVTLRIISFL